MTETLLFNVIGWNCRERLSEIAGNERRPIFAKEVIGQCGPRAGEHRPRCHRRARGSSGSLPVPSAISPLILLDAWALFSTRIPIMSLIMCAEARAQEPPDDWHKATRVRGSGCESLLPSGHDGGFNRRGDVGTASRDAAV